MRPAVVLVALAALVAGCTGASEPPTFATSSTGGVGGAPGTGGAGALVPEVNAATAWVQAYWAERTEVVLVDETLTLANTVDTPVTGCFLSCRFGFVQPAEGTFVAPGTERVELVATFTRPASAPGAVVTMFHRTASPTPEQGQALLSGERVVLPVDAEKADAPFAPASQWWFWFNVQSPSVEHIPPFDLALRIVAYRAEELPELPEASDPWNGGTTLALIEGHEAPEELTTYNPVTGYSCRNCNIGWDSRGSGLVPAGAAELQASVRWDWAGLTKPRLWAWNALDEGTAMELVEDGAQARTFRLAVPPEQVDSPYQQRSHWGFYFTFETQGLDVAVMHGRAVVDVTVVRAA